MDILVTVNRAYLYPLSVMLKSLVCQHPGTPMRVFVLHRSLTTEDLTALERSVDESALTLVPVAADPHLLPQAPTTDRYPMEMYDRIFAAFQLPQELERVLYLDPDLVVNHPLDSLWELPLEEYFFAAASHVAKGMEKFNAIRLQSETPGPLHQFRGAADEPSGAAPGAADPARAGLRPGPPQDPASPRPGRDQRPVRRPHPASESPGGTT